MLNGVFQTTLGERTHLASSIPKKTDERMPGRREGITTDVSGTATVEHVLEIRAVPDLLVNLVLHRVEVVRRPL